MAASRPVEKAVVLAAGMGRRLLPLTSTTPKPLLPLNGVPILRRSLEALRTVGISRTLVVVGHLKERIYREIGSSVSGMSIDYVESLRYESTNNIYSIWLARDFMDADVLLLEGDIVFETPVLNALRVDDDRTCLAVTRFEPGMSGAAVTLDAGGRIRSLEIVAAGQALPRTDAGSLRKTLSIQLFRKQFLSDRFLPAVSDAVSRGQVGEFYENVLQRLILQQSADVYAVDCSGFRWIEIDDHRDYDNARAMFADLREAI